MWRILIDDPYANGKASVFSAVGTANRCRVVHSSALGLVTVLGYDHDLAAVELLGFADRIGQRLREATDAQVSATAGGAGQVAADQANVDASPHRLPEA